MTSTVVAVVASVCSVLTVGVACASAQSYPTKPIRTVVPFPAGGGIDTVIRLLAPNLAERLGQTIVVDNRSGAGGTVGSEIVAKSAPDGHTLLATFSSHATNATLYRNLKFDTVKDFAPITLIGTVPNILVINPSMAVRNVRELIALAKQRPGEILYASVGNGTPAHLTAELFNAMAGVDMRHVAYRGSANSIVSLIAGETQVTFTTVLVADPHVKAGKLRALAVASLKRSTAMPGIPTIDESGVKGFESTAWYGLLAPAGVPRSVVERLNSAAVSVLGLPQIRDRLAQLGTEAVGSTPEAFDRLIRRDISKWGKLVSALGLVAD